MADNAEQELALAVKREASVDSLASDQAGGSGAPKSPAGEEDPLARAAREKKKTTKLQITLPSESGAAEAAPAQKSARRRGRGTARGRAKDGKMKTLKGRIWGRRPSARQDKSEGADDDGDGKRDKMEAAAMGAHRLFEEEDTQERQPPIKVEVVVNGERRLPHVVPNLLQIMKPVAQFGRRQEALEEEATGEDTKEDELFWNTYAARSRDAEKTALGYAARENHVFVFKVLCEMGAKLDQPDAKGKTPLFHAAAHGNLAIVDYIIVQGGELYCRDNEGATALHVAAKHGHSRVVTQFLDTDDLVDQMDGMSRTPLHLAAAEGQLKVVKLLVDKGANVNLRDSYGDSPLHFAARRGHAAVCGYLIDQGAVIYAADSDGISPLHFAARNGHVGVVRVIVESLVESDLGVKINQSDDDGWTGLHFAAWKGHVTVLDVLLQSNALIDKKNEKGRTAIHFATFKGYSLIVRKLIEAGANLAQRDEDGASLLHSAAENGHTDVVRQLVQAQVDVDAKDEQGWTALNAAVREGNMDVIVVLVEDGKATVDDPNNQGRCALRTAAWKGNVQALEYLIEHGADVNHSDRAGWTAMHSAAANGHRDAVKLLLEQGANVDAKELHDDTPLHFAAREGHDDIVKLLVSANAELDQRDKKGRSPLSTAVWEGHADVVRTLVQAGAVTSQRSRTGETLLHVAAREGHLDIVRFLVGEGVEINVTSFDGNTPLHAAARKGHREIVKIFLDHSMAEDRFGNYEFNLEALIPERVSKGDRTPLRIIVDKGWHEMLIHPTVSAALDKLWNSYAIQYAGKRLLGYMCLIIVFTIVAVVPAADGTPFVYEGLDFARVPFEVLVVAFAFYSLYEELMEVMTLGYHSYLNNLWNAFDVITYVMIIMILPFRMKNVMDYHDGKYTVDALGVVDIEFGDDERGITAVAAILLWTKLLKHGLGFRLTGPFVVMIQKVMFSFLEFVGFFMVFHLALTTAFHITFGANVLEYSSWGGTIMTLLQMLLGEFDYDVIRRENAVMAPLLFVFYVVVANILLLNLLIAILSNAYHQVQDSSGREWKREWAKYVLTIVESLDLNDMDFKEMQQAYAPAADVDMSALKPPHTLDTLAARVNALESVLQRVDITVGAVLDEVTFANDATIAKVHPDFVDGHALTVERVTEEKVATPRQ